MILEFAYANSALSGGVDIVDIYIDVYIDNIDL
jgi:hypothetical protein